MVLLEDAIDHDDTQSLHLDQVLRAASKFPVAQAMYRALIARAATSMQMLVAESLFPQWLCHFVNRDTQELGLNEIDDPILMAAFHDAAGTALEALGHAQGPRDGDTGRRTAKHVHCAYALVRLLEEFDEHSD